MTVWTLTYNWVEIGKEEPAMDTMLLGIYATKELAKKALKDEVESTLIKDKSTFHMEDEFASVDLADRRYLWEIEEWEVQGYNTDVVSPSYCHADTMPDGSTVVTIMGYNSSAAPSYVKRDGTSRLIQHDGIEHPL